ncbi:MAG TPA: XRE family transcriptional regulator [Janthinobacterium sp.]|nr:XRE family transcriptional regulator [Janthinobacterium sp.]
MADLHRLPNLAALRAFEAAARHENFSRAAEEIHVTHGAVSHQVRGLEEELGVQLFTRKGKRIAVTDEGQRFAAIVRKSLMDIAVAAAALKASAGQKRLTITAMPSLAARWLAPRLGNFIDLYPDIEVVLQSSGQVVDLERQAIDVGIRFGSGNYPGLTVEKLMDDYYYPAASPRLNGGELPATAQDLGRFHLLRGDDEPWLPWLRAAGSALAEPSGGIVYHDLAMLLRAAAHGDGIALARHVIVMQEICSGELVRLFDVAVKCPFSYYFVCTPQALLRPEVRAFHDWLFAQVRQFDTVCGWPQMSERLYQHEYRQRG